MKEFGHQGKRIVKTATLLCEDPQISLLVQRTPYKIERTRKVIEKLRIGQLRSFADLIFLSSRSGNPIFLHLFTKSHKKKTLREHFKHKTSLNELKRDPLLLKKVIVELSTIVPRILEEIIKTEKHEGD